MMRLGDRWDSLVLVFEGWGRRRTHKGKKGATWESDAKIDLPSAVWVVTTRRGGGS